MAQVNSIAFSPDSKLMASSSADQTVGLWDMETWRQVGRLIGHQDRVNAVAFLPNENRRVISGLDMGCGSGKATGRINRTWGLCYDGRSFT